MAREGTLTINPAPAYPEIIIALHLLETSPPRFHWALFVPNPDSDSGTKFHAVSPLGSPIWEYERTTEILQNSISVAAAAIIGKLKDHTLDEFDTLLCGIPMEVPVVDSQKEPKLTCRVWIREAVRRLNRAGYIQCSDVDALEEEMWDYGRAAAKDIENDNFKMAKLVQAMNSK